MRNSRKDKNAQDQSNTGSGIVTSEKNQNQANQFTHFNLNPQNKVNAKTFSKEVRGDPNLEDNEDESQDFSSYEDSMDTNREEPIESESLISNPEFFNNQTQVGYGFNNQTQTQVGCGFKNGLTTYSIYSNEAYQIGQGFNSPLSLGSNRFGHEQEFSLESNSPQNTDIPTEPYFW